MKYIVIAAILYAASLMIFINTAHSAEVNCYSAGKLIFKGHNAQVYYDDHSIVIHNKRTKKDTFVFADCVVSI